MTNKMPVVGRRYEHRLVDGVKVSIKKITDGKIYLNESNPESWTYRDFFNNFRELPEDNKKGIVAIFPDFAEEPNQPTEALKAEMANEKKEVIAHYHSKKIEPKIDMKEECVKAKDIDVPTKSIWKDVSELPDSNYEEGIIKLDNDKYVLGCFNIYTKRWYAPSATTDISSKKVATLTDFINSFEQMQKDIEELKRNKLEGK